ncbi:hypothetical protein MTP09_04500 [Chryseobacterium suipulveris]|uniref:Uncharacterized protein n=1 Tax=Chryseobacterium suipulveris TaxID=2929800 RepID=A0ABY4BRS7_9FLAO|nr:hypothetical protein [Chryseobacterium suipulveris]UOE41898.1 hypothetical protein MTP09_04500 [Chryseobacterium suipulveris]
MLDENAFEEYMKIIDEKTVDNKKYEIVKIEDTDKKRFVDIENTKVTIEESNSYYRNNYNKLKNRR